MAINIIDPNAPAQAHVDSYVALATYCGQLLARPLPCFPLPALRRTYQRAMYAYVEVQDWY